MKNKFFFWQPILFSIILIVGMYLGSRIGKNTNIVFSNDNTEFQKINDILTYIQEYYVDTVNSKQLLDLTINSILQNLDPHSYYIPKEELAAVNEPLQGNFEGIGIEFNIQRDTIMVISPISGGPSDQAGLRPGDRIVKVDGKHVAGVKITNQEVFKRLKGKKGTKVVVTVFRPGSMKLLDFSIIRDKISTHSIDAAFMIDKNTAYLKLSKFSATTIDEFQSESEKLIEQGMSNLIFDLRGNGGGFLDAAVNISSAFLEKGMPIVYTKGKSRPQKNYNSPTTGILVNTNVVVLIDEWSASASEIVAGAIQDNDRGIIIGRRSFGKGLVQEQVLLPDSSAIRLTIARYYTPTGRCIQKDYTKGTDEYYFDLLERYETGELLAKDSIKINDSIKYITPNGKVLYGGGGIVPDVFVPIDTNGASDYLAQIQNKNLINQFAFIYIDNKREALKKQFISEITFYSNFKISAEILHSFTQYAESNGVKFNQNDFDQSKEIIINYLKAFISRHLYGFKAFYRNILDLDKAFTIAKSNLIK